MPHIYSFVTNTLPNYLKVGDTYRPVEERLNEWRKHYKDLKEVSRHKATINDEVFFRDYAVHKYLQQKGITQIPLDISKNVYSNEFFEGAGESHVSEAVDDVVKNYQKTDTYAYYNSAKDRVEYHYERTQEFAPRQNQQEVINSFGTAIKNGRTNLLMYAVMRFGKSIASIWSARTIDSKLTVVVSAKADVRSEWKQTVESHKDFIGYRFIDKDNLKSGMKLADLYGKEFKTGSCEEEICTNIVLFLTLQDLAGSSEIIKNHHKILNNAQINLLIIDETHFGARAPVLGKILAGVELDEDEKKSLKNDKEDPERLGSLDKLEAINAEIKLHLSGTPYRILMGGEFEKEDVIAFVQFSDIYEAKLLWGVENLDEDEWDNPYYGFPQMIRFAFNPNESSRKKLADISGSKPAELFTPASINKNGNYETFVYEQEVIDLLQVLDGSKNDTNMLGLLDNETVKAGKLARHVVMVLPYRASCDALEKLIIKNTRSFKNIAEYKLFNISGFNQALNTPEDIKSAIAEAELAGKKTITFTVNKMLTGTTVPQWDTMIYLKGTTSPQEYDQAIFRLQSPWVQEYQDENGDTIKYDMKPQTLLVDLDPTRLFHLQEMKAFTYGANTQNIGNEKIAEFIKRELIISPIIALNAEGNKLVEVTATTIIDEVRKYVNDRTITEDVQGIGIDVSLKDNQAIFEIINKLAELGGKGGLTIKPNEEEGEELVSVADADGAGVMEDTSARTSMGDDGDTEDISSFEKRFRTYYVMVLLFAFLSNTEERSLTDVIESIDANEDNRRIAENLGLKKTDLVLIREHLNPFVRSTLDYKIQNADFRSSDSSITRAEHIDIAIHKFGRLSSAEVFTPSPIVNQIYDSFGEGFWHNAKDMRVLDIASKSGSFAKGFVENATQHGANREDIKDNFYSIPTSPAAYEFTRKMYEALGLNVDNIARHFNSFDLIKLEDEELQNTLSQGKKFSEIRLSDFQKPAKMKDKRSTGNMKFTVIVGNPPYQQKDGGAQASAKPIYNLFVEIAKKINPSYISMIIPTRWYAGGKGLDDFRDQMLNDVHISELHDFLKPELVFKNINLRGGICYFLWDRNYDNTKDLTKVFTYEDNLTPNANIRSLKTIDSDILIRHTLGVNILEKIKSHSGFETFEDHVSSRRPFDLDGNIIKDTEVFRPSTKGLKNPVICYGKGKKIGYLERDKITRNIAWIDRYKVFTPRANNIGTELNDDNLNTFIGKPNTICTESYIMLGANLKLNESSAQNLSKYFRTKFARFQHSVGKASQDATSKTYKFIPLQDFTKKSDIDWTKPVSEIDKQLFKKYALDKRETDFIETHVKAMS